nr:hypothetical protein [uncultured Devosia sp.]
MQTTSYISAAALAAALLITPQTAQAQLLGLDVDLDVLGVEADADVNVGGGSLLDADVDVGSSTGNGSTSSGNGGLVDVDIDIGHGPATGPNGGTLIDLTTGGSHNAALDADLDLLNGNPPKPGSALVTGDIRIAALEQGARKPALLDRIDHPNLAGIDLDAAIDDRQVAILAAVDLLGPDNLADIRAAIGLGGDGRTELLDAIAASAELNAILDKQGIDPNDVLAVQVAENGATEVIVLDGLVEVALLGDGGDLADLTAGELANLDIDLLSRDELAEIDLDLLPDDLRTTAQLRLLGSDSDDADLTPAELAAIDLDLLFQDELAELDVALLPAPLGAAVSLRLLEDDGALADRTVGDLAALDLSLLPGAGNTGGTNGTGNAGGTGNTGSTGGNDDSGSTPSRGTDMTTTGSTSGGGDGSGGSPQTGGAMPEPAGKVQAVAANGVAPAPVIGTTPPAQLGAGFNIATLGCDIGVLALASGADATPQAIASADTLELVRIDGCERSLVDSDVASIRAAIDKNPAISGVLDDAQIPLDQVIGATIQADTLTLFIAPSLS